MKKRNFLLLLALAVILGLGPGDPNATVPGVSPESLLAKAVVQSQWVDWEGMSRDIIVARQLKMISAIRKKLEISKPLNDKEAVMLVEFWAGSDQHIAAESRRIVSRILDDIENVDITKQIGGEELARLLNYYAVIGGMILSLDDQSDRSLFKEKKDILARQGDKVIVPLVLYGLANRERTVRFASSEVITMIDESPDEVAGILFEFFTVEYNDVLNDRTINQLRDVFVALEDKNGTAHEIYDCLMNHAAEALSVYCSLDKRRDYDEKSLSRITRLVTALSP